MTVLAQSALSGLLILSSAFGASAFPIRDGPSVFAPEAVVALQKRAIMKGDNYVPLGSTTVPLSPLLLVFAGLAAAFVGLAIALLRIFVPSCMSRSSRIVLEERERARQDLRVRGAVSPRDSPGGSPTPGGSTPTTAQARRFPPNKPTRPLGHNSRGSFTPGQSSTSTLTNKRASHGYRGTSFSLKDARMNTEKSYRSSLSGLQLPLLNSSESSSGSSTLHVNQRDSTMSERAKYPIMATNDSNTPGKVERPRLGFGTRHLQRTSSTGKGADLQRTRSGRQRAEIAVQPRAVAPAYAQQWRRGDSNSHQHPLQTASNRRDSVLSMGEMSSSAGHSYMESNATSRIGSFSNMSGNPLQPLSMPGFGAGAHANPAWASPRSTSRSPSLEYGSPDPSRLGAVHNAVGNSRNSSVSGLFDSDGSDHSAPHTAVLIPSRATSNRR
ncbi:hypothetical protein EX895_006458 [Sporisorium graminicola]|uniref:Uncharacterized protein n=1 Tax=Sporisorium graminicola TaxID=280036 RepID=A0A4U7KL88_9BASI|nr:hypothetical protein EX895_006458 [Sporisorium graminicola]TKY84556.1 hypothetical protein EX895_006458 [Sporisorium graminicola]